MCLLGVSMLCLSVILIFDFGVRRCGIFVFYFFILFTNVYINYQYCYGQHDHIYTVLDIDLTQIDRYLNIHRID
jgi:hypothetical protein